MRLEKFEAIDTNLLKFNYFNEEVKSIHNKLKEQRDLSRVLSLCFLIFI